MTALPDLRPLRLPDGRELLVVRDDLYPGGTKARVLPQVLDAFPDREFVYAGPAQGYAQVALAHSARKVGRSATVFVPQRKRRHRLTRDAAAAGAQIIEVPYGRMSVLRARARDYAARTGARNLPFGFDFPEFHRALTNLAASLPVDPHEVWCVAGSGALSRALAAAWPAARLHAVRIGAEPRTPPGATVRTAPEPFEADAEQPPPFPSCANYDAKLWRFVRRHATNGALVWNVAA